MWETVVSNLNFRKRVLIFFLNYPNRNISHSLRRHFWPFPKRKEEEKGKM